MWLAVGITTLCVMFGTIQHFTKISTSKLVLVCHSVCRVKNCNTLFMERFYVYGLTSGSWQVQ